MLLQKKSKPRQTARLAFEVLEDRTVPSSGVDVVTGDPNDWPMYNHDPEGTRNNIGETALSTSTVGDLGVRWSFPTHGPISGTPAVVNDRVYAADAAGYVYALDRDGNPLWETELNVGPVFGFVKVTASALVTNRTVVIGDLSGQIHGLDIDTGAVKWTTRPNPHPFSAIWGSPTMVGNNVAIGISSEEEFYAPFLGADYHPTFRGSLALLDPGTGEIVWQTYTISDAESAAGSSGSPIWSSPTYDRATNTIYVTTGNNYSEPTQGTSDAFIAIDAATGAIKWVNQRTENDHWTPVFGDSTDEHPDFDIGDSPQFYRMGNRTFVSAGQKSGYFHVLDAATGEEVNSPIQLAPGGTVGGLFADSAYADGVVYANGIDWPIVLGGEPPNRGILSAVAADGSHELWHFDTPFSPNSSGVAVANGVVYFQSLFGMFYALNAKTGEPLAQVFTGSLTSGPAISRGQVYVGAGDAAFTFLTGQPIGPGAVIALGLPASAGGASTILSVASEAGLPPAADPIATGPTLKGPLPGTLQFDATNGLATFDGSGHLTLMGKVAVHGEFLFAPGDESGSFVGTGVAVFTAANGDVLVANVLWYIDPSGEGRLEFRWPGEITLRDGSTVRSTGRFVELPFGGLRATSTVDRLDVNWGDGIVDANIKMTGEIVDPDPIDT